MLHSRRLVGVLRRARHVDTEVEGLTVSIDRHEIADAGRHWKLTLDGHSARPELYIDPHHCARVRGRRKVHSEINI